MQILSEHNEGSYKWVCLTWVCPYTWNCPRNRNLDSEPLALISFSLLMQFLLLSMVVLILLFFVRSVQVWFTC